MYGTYVCLWLGEEIHYVFSEQPIQNSRLNWTWTMERRKWRGTKIQSTFLHALDWRPLLTWLSLILVLLFLHESDLNFFVCIFLWWDLILPRFWGAVPSRFVLQEQEDCSSRWKRAERYDRSVLATAATSTLALAHWYHTSVCICCIKHPQSEPLSISIIAMMEEVSGSTKPWLPKAIQRASQDYLHEIYPLYALLLPNGIPNSTLQGRLRSAQPARTIAHQKQQLFDSVGRRR